MEAKPEDVNMYRLDLESLISWLTLYAQKLPGQCYRSNNKIITKELSPSSLFIKTRLVVQESVVMSICCKLGNMTFWPQMLYYWGFSKYCPFIYMFNANNLLWKSICVEEICSQHYLKVLQHSEMVRRFPCIFQSSGCLWILSIRGSHHYYTLISFVMWQHGLWNFSLQMS